MRCLSAPQPGPVLVPLVTRRQRFPLSILSNFYYKPLCQLFRKPRQCNLWVRVQSKLCILATLVRRNYGHCELIVLKKNHDVTMVFLIQMLVLLFNGAAAGHQINDAAINL